ncbi:MAG: hypothetical protein ACT4QD_25270 [Acidobacteriota bacterium]
MEQINRHADALNAEAADVLAYQGMCETRRPVPGAALDIDPQHLID